MGTSGSYGGPGGGTPLVPSWLGPAGTLPAPAVPPSAPPGQLQPTVPAGSPSAPGAPPGTIPSMPAAPPSRLQPQQLPSTDRFTSARTAFSGFAGSGGGGDRGSLGRSVSRYVSKSTGGARRAAQRMGSSRGVGGQLYNFLSDVQNRGAKEALRSLNLQALAGRPIEEVFLGLADYVCPTGGSVDEGIARDAFIETIADLATLGIEDLNSLTPEQMNTVFEMYATHAIEARISNDIGTKSIALPSDLKAIERVQGQLRDLIRRGVSDALARASASAGAIMADRVLDFVTGVYELAFEVLQTLGDAEEAA